MKIYNIDLLCKNKKGESLVEVSVALTISILIATSMLTVVVASKTILYNSDDRTKATFLVQEGIEMARHQRDINCKFQTVAEDVSAGQNDFAVTSDMYDSGNALNNDNKIVPNPDFAITPDKIDNYDGNPVFSREIRIYDLEAFYNANSGNPDYQWIKENFPDTAPGFDQKSKYYIIEVEIFWEDRYTGATSSLESSSIMSKE